MESINRSMIFDKERNKLVNAREKRENIEKDFETLSVQSYQKNLDEIKTLLVRKIFFYLYVGKEEINLGNQIKRRL